METILLKYPNLHKLYNSYPIHKLSKHLHTINVQEKLDFVHEMNELSVKNYEDIFRGKKVAIIGPSPSIYNEENGDYIEENYDLIVRINKQWRHDQDLNKYIGKRTDILYNCMNPSEECGGIMNIKHAKEQNLNLIIDPIMFGHHMSNTRDHIFHGIKRVNFYVIFHLNNQNNIPFGMINMDKYIKWDNQANTRINTGLLAILDVLSSDAKEVYIKGFTFFKDGYISNYRNKIAGKETNEENSSELVLSYMNKYSIHDQEKQWKFFKKFIQDEHIQRKIKMDESLTQIMALSSYS